MSNDVSRVYQFLANLGDWKTKADKNSDGTIIKSEFSSFMEENYDWNGETTDAGKNDLINSFWKAIDTNQGGKISGTKYKNKNALDSKEINAMQDRIAIYEKLNEYVADIQAPNEISDKAGWKKSISASLTNTTETLIKQGVTADTLAEELDKIIENVKNKTTADYCANEYLNTSMKDVVKQYGYAYADDATLKGIIDNFVNNLPEDSDSASIKQTVEEIVDAYMATATGDGSEEISILEQYGYTPSNNTAMNDLQKSIVKTKLTEALADLKNEADYKNNSALYDTAINEYIDSILNDKTYGDYTNDTIEYSLQAFKDSETGKALTKTIEVKNLFYSDEFKASLTDKLSSSFADRISGLMQGEISAYDDIQAQALEKAKNGDFDTNGTLDTRKAIDWIVEQMTQRLTEFYPNGLNDMSLTDLATMYDKLVESAKANEDAASVKTAALSYCNAVAKKSTKLAEAVKDIFGSSYSTEINKLTTPEIEAKMTDLKAKVEEIGDISTMTEAEKNALTAGIKDSYTVVQNSTNNTISVPTSGYCNGKLITSDRFAYKVSGSLTKDSSGNISIDTSKAGTYTGTITIVIDGKEIATKTVTVTISTKQDFMNKLQEDKNTKINGASIADIMLNGNNRIMLSGFHRNGGNSFNDTKSAAKTALKSELNNIVKILESAGYATGMLQKAVTTTYNYYIAAIDSLTDQVFNKGVYDCETSFTYTDADGTSHTENNKYRQQTYRYESSAKGSDYEGNDVSTTGLFLGESYNDTNTYCIYLNTRTLLNRLMSFI